MTAREDAAAAAAIANLHRAEAERAAALRQIVAIALAEISQRLMREDPR